MFAFSVSVQIVVRFTDVYCVGTEVRDVQKLHISHMV